MGAVVVGAVVVGAVVRGRSCRGRIGMSGHHHKYDVFEHSEKNLWQI